MSLQNTKGCFKHIVEIIVSVNCYMKTSRCVSTLCCGWNSLYGETLKRRELTGVDAGCRELEQVSGDVEEG